MQPPRALRALAAATLMATSSLALAQPCPQITVQPAPRQVCPTASPTLSVQASGPAPLSYQWQVHRLGDWADIGEGADIFVDSDAIGYTTFYSHSQGSSSPQLTITGIDPGAGGGYFGGLVDFRCVVSSGCGVAMSDPASVRICLLDLDCSGQYTPASVAYAVNIWFVSLQNGTLDGDFDRGRSVDPSDIAYYLSAWFMAVTTGTCY